MSKIRHDKYRSIAPERIPHGLITRAQAIGRRAGRTFNEMAKQTREAQQLFDDTDEEQPEYNEDRDYVDFERF